MIHALTMCHQVPSMLTMFHHLGLFYSWHPFQTPPSAHIVYEVSHP